MANRGPDGLTDFEREVCHAVDRGLSDRAAYREADPFSKITDASAAHYVWHLRRRPHCAAYLAALKAKALARHLHAKDQVIAELAAVAFANLGDFLAWGPDGLEIRPLDDLSPEQYRALGAVTITRTAQGRSVRLRTHDKLAALRELCKLLGLAGTGDAARLRAAAELSDVERAQRLAAILRLADRTAADGEADEATGADDGETADGDG